jgi:hypothetical protein
MASLNWRFTRKRTGMCIDGHVHKDVMEYHNQFLERWKEYEKRFITYDNNGNILKWLTGFPVHRWGGFS